MRVWTSYFAMEHRLPEGYKPFSIALYSPDTELWSFPDLAPTEEILTAWKMYGDQGMYIEEYQKNILERLDPHATWKAWEAMGHENIVLMCWEGSGKFCHRHLVAKWFKDAGYPVTELQFEKKGC